MFTIDSVGGAAAADEACSVTTRVSMRIPPERRVLTTPFPVVGSKTTAGKTRAEVLLGTAEPARLTVRRGPKGDPETDRRTLQCYEAARSRGLTSSEAIAEVSTEMSVSMSQVYRRMAKARQRRGDAE